MVVRASAFDIDPHSLVDRDVWSGSFVSWLVTSPACLRLPSVGWVSLCRRCSARRFSAVVNKIGYVK